MESKIAISLYVNNKPGVLVRLAQAFARRGFNMESLVVSPANDPQFSRMTIVAQGEEDTFEQIIKQLNKLIDVVHAMHHNVKNAVERELAIFKVSVDREKRSEVFQIIDVFRGKTVDITADTIMIEATGNSDKLNGLQKLLNTLGKVEMVRSGKLIMARGTEET